MNLVGIYHVWSRQVTKQLVTSSQVSDLVTQLLLSHILYVTKVS